MAMIEVGLEEFVSDLIDTKAGGATVDEARRECAMRELLAIADKAVDVAIMRAVLRNVLNRSASKHTVDRLHDLMQSGSKSDTLTYLQQILPDFVEVIGDELVKFEEMYLRSPPAPQSDP